MSITVINEDNDLRILTIDGQIERGKIVRMFTEDELRQLERERRAELDVQMPSFIRGDEDESAEELF